MSDGRVTICFIHGVTRAGSAADDSWATAVESTMALQGFARPSDRGIESITIDYRGEFTKDLERSELPPRTDGALAKTALSDARAAYEIRRGLVSRNLRHLVPRGPAQGWAQVPDNAADLAAQAVPLLLKPLREQARRYSTDEKLRRAVITRTLDQMPDTGHLVIVGHSLGSVVALDVIPRLAPDVEVSLVTVGSPLSMSSYWGHVKFAGDRFPIDRMRSWVNVFDATDPVTSGRGVSSRFPEAIDIQVSFGAIHALVRNHVSLYYLSLPVVAAAVADAVYDRGATSADTAVVRTEPLSEGWHLPLLAAVHASQISRTTSERKYAWRTRFDAARRISVDRVLEQARLHAEELQPAERSLPLHTDLMDHASSHVRGQWSDEQLVALAVGLLMASPVQPFDLNVASDHVEIALVRTLNRVRRGDSSTSDQEFAECLTASLEEVAAAIRPRGRRFGPYLLIAGAALLAATGVGLWASAPVGVAGAAALTSMLASFGPGGMVGGMLTLALGSSIGSALVASGAADAVKGSPGRRLEAAEFVQNIARMPNEQLEASVIGWLACVRARDRLGFESEVDQIRNLLERVLVEVENERNSHRELGSSRESEWAIKAQSVRRGLDWLDAMYPPAFVDAVHQALKRSTGEVSASIAAIESRLRSESRHESTPAIPSER